jgi:preprotein translocase SecE subunit
MRPRTVDFLIATDSEMKRVNWSTPREIRGSTYVVIGACFLLAAALFIFDLIFKTVFQSMGILGN